MLEFGQFFFPEVFEIAWSPMHIDLLRSFVTSTRFAKAAPRGHGKTTVMSLAGIYCIVNTLDHFILMVSDTYGQAKDIVDGIKQQLEGNEWLRWVYGDLTTDYHWTSGAFTTSNDVRVMARGSQMKVRGLKFRHWRPSRVLGDDMENDEAVESEDRRIKLENWVRKALLPSMSRDGKAGFVGTILHEDSLLSKMVNGKPGYAGWNRTIFKALIDEGTALWPGHLPAEKLLKMRDDPSDENYVGPLVFSQEYQNEPVDEAARIIKAEWIYGPENDRRTYNLAEKEQQWLNENPGVIDPMGWLRSTMVKVIAAVDPAISESDHADYFAYVVVGIDKRGHLWVLDIFRERTSDFDKQVDFILNMFEQWKPDQIKIESVAYQKGLYVAVKNAGAKRGIYPPVFEVKPDKDKFRRAVMHSANFAGGLVHIRTDHALSDAFISEILTFPKGKHDDMFDAYMHATEETVARTKRRIHTNKPTGF